MLTKFQGLILDEYSSNDKPETAPRAKEKKKYFLLFLLVCYLVSSVVVFESRI